MRQQGFVVEQAMRDSIMKRLLSPYVLGSYDHFIADLIPSVTVKEFRKIG